MGLWNWDRVFDRFFDGFDYSNSFRTPAVDVREDDDKYLMEMELPGLTEKDVNVKVEDGVLTISSKKEESKEEKDEGYLRRERRHHSFSRSFTLPDNVDVDKITANFKNGLLDVSVPKSPAAKPKLIEVKVK
jgi:HSP20 family protein